MLRTFKHWVGPRLVSIPRWTAAQLDVTGRLGQIVPPTKRAQRPRWGVDPDAGMIPLIDPCPPDPEPEPEPELTPPTGKVLYYSFEEEWTEINAGNPALNFFVDAVGSGNDLGDNFAYPTAVRVAGVQGFGQEAGAPTEAGLLGTFASTSFFSDPSFSVLPAGANFLGSCWLYVPAVLGHEMSIWRTDGFRLHIDATGRLVFSYGNPAAAGALIPFTSTDPVPLGAWFLASFGWDKAAELATLAVDLTVETFSEPALTGGFHVGVLPDDLVLWQGFGTDAAPRWFEGRIDEAGFFEDTPSADKIAWIYNGGAGRTFAEYP